MENRVIILLNIDNSLLYEMVLVICSTPEEVVGVRKKKKKVRITVNKRELESIRLSSESSNVFV